MSFLARRTVAAAPRAARAFSTTPSRPLAKITIVGNLVQTPELQATSTGREVLKYAVASNVGRGDNTKTSYFRVSSFEAEGPRRDYFQSLPKGSVSPLLLSMVTKVSGIIGVANHFPTCRTLVYVEGDATNDKYEDAEGKTRTALNIVQRESPLNPQHLVRRSVMLTVTDLQEAWRSSASPGEMLPQLNSLELTKRRAAEVYN